VFVTVFICNTDKKRSDDLVILAFICRCKRLKSGTVEETILGGAPDPKDEDIKEDEDEGLDEDSLEEVYRQDSNNIYCTVIYG
jgi:hypothetical protein